MDIKLKIPFRSECISLFVSNIPAWLIWFIVIFAFLAYAINCNFFNF